MSTEDLTKPLSTDSARLVAEEIARRWIEQDLPFAAEIHSLSLLQLQALAEHVISKHLAAAQQWRQGMRDAAKEVCDACDNEERYSPARKIEGSTRWWHGDDNIPCEAGGIWHALAERGTGTADPADNDAEG